MVRWNCFNISTRLKGYTRVQQSNTSAKRKPWAFLAVLAFAAIIVLTFVPHSSKFSLTQPKEKLFDTFLPNSDTKAVIVSLSDRKNNPLSMDEYALRQWIAFLLQPHRNPNYRFTKILWEFSIDSFETDLIQNTNKINKALGILNREGISVDVLFKPESLEGSRGFQVRTAAIALNDFKEIHPGFSGVVLDISTVEGLESCLSMVRNVHQGLLGVLLQKPLFTDGPGVSSIMQDLFAQKTIDFIGLKVQSQDYMSLRDSVLESESMLGENNRIVHILQLPGSSMAEEGYVYLEEVMEAVTKEFRFDNMFGGFALEHLGAYRELRYGKGSKDIPGDVPIQGNYNPVCKSTRDQIVVLEVPEHVSCVLRTDTFEEAKINEGIATFPKHTSDILPEVALFSTRLAPGVCVNRVGPPIFCARQEVPSKTLPNYITRSLWIWASDLMDLYALTDSELIEFIQFLVSPREQNKNEFNRIVWDLGDDVGDLLSRTESRAKITHILSELHLAGLPVDLLLSEYIDIYQVPSEQVIKEMKEVCQTISDLPLGLEHFDGLILDLNPQRKSPPSEWTAVSTSLPEAWWKDNSHPADAFNDEWENTWLTILKECKAITDVSGVALSTILGKEDHFHVSEVFNAITTHGLVDFLVVTNYYNSFDDMCFGTEKYPHGGIEKVLQASSIPVMFASTILPTPYAKEDETYFELGITRMEDDLRAATEFYMHNQRFAGVLIHDYPSYLNAPLVQHTQ